MKVMSNVAEINAWPVNVLYAGYVSVLLYFKPIMRHASIKLGYNANFHVCKW